MGSLYEDTRLFSSSIFAAFSKRIPAEQLIFTAAIDSQDREILLQEIRDSQLRVVFVLASDSLSAATLLGIQNGPCLSHTPVDILQHRAVKPITKHQF